MTPNRQRSNGRGIFDRILYQRIVSYCQKNVDYDAENCAESLRSQYREYQRQKVGPFTLQVKRAIQSIVHEEEESDGTEKIGATMNSSLKSMYNTSDGNEKEPQLGHGSGKEVVEKVAKVGPSQKGSKTPSGSKRPRVSGSRRGLSSSATQPLPIKYEDLGGVDSVLKDVQELIEYPLKHPEVYSWLGVYPPRGVLLHGPPGCGKTALANAIANECKVPFLRISAPEVVSGMSGESEAKVRSLFQEAASVAPCIVFIDEIDAIAPKRETAQREMERRIVAQLLTCMDDLSALSMDQNAGSSDSHGNGDDSKVESAAEDVMDVEKDVIVSIVNHKHVVVIGATNRPDALDPALRRAGRFDREITMGIPSESSREAILRKMAKKLRLDGTFSFSEVARKTPGFVGADLAALIKEAAALAVQRIFNQIETDSGCLSDREGPLTHDELKSLSIKLLDFEGAIDKVQPSVRREGFATTPDVTWNDVGSLVEVRDELLFAISRPISNPHLFEAMGLKISVGVLLFGPPGCGKTLVAKAVANDSGANFISIKGPELLNKYVGESERAVRQVFSRARAAAPCVLFFDELDALAPRRGSDSSGAAAERVVNQLLTEMDGVDGRQGVYLVAATNRPDMIDPALLRPGRLEKILYVPLPPPEGRASILQALTRATPLASDVDLEELAAMPELTGFSGADLASLVREASVQALKEKIDQDQWGAGRSEPKDTILVMRKHFISSLSRLRPSVSRKDQKMYDSLRLKLRSSRGHLKGEEPKEETDGRPNAGSDGNLDPMIS